MTTAHRVDPLVGPVPGRVAMLRMNSPAEIPAPSPSVMSQSRLETVSVTLVQAVVTMFFRRGMSLGQNCWVSFQP